jgi:hypothetical protein
MGFVGKLEEIRARARQHIEDGAVTKIILWTAIRS